MTCRPGHAPRHPDFEAGNEERTTHGAHSERRWRPLAEALKAEAIAEAPWLSRPSFAAAVAAWSVTEAKAHLVDAWLDEHGLLDAKGVPHPANALADRLASRCITLRSQLGLDPTSFARLLATFANVGGGEDALAALKAEGRKLMEARAPELSTGEAS
jgi:phage terminase small subunit